MALDIGKIKINLKEVLTKYGEAIIKEINNQLSKAGAKTSNNITFNIKEENTILSLEISVPDYVKYINSGRKAGSMPPIDHIVDWVISKNIQPIRKNGGLPRKSKTSLFEKQRRTAFVIAKSIKENGIPAKDVIDPAVNKAEKGIGAEIPNEIIGPIQDLVKQGLKDAFASSGSNNVKIT